MTYRELYLKWKKELLSPDGGEVMLLFERFFSLDRAGLALHGDETPDHESEKAFLKAAEEYKNHRPLQYILGKWDFMGLSLSVGEGVLIPREDTAALVNAAAERIPAGAKGLDLCAGTGAAALGLCSLVPDTTVECVEISDKAVKYLSENIAAYPQYGVTYRKGDILKAETAAGYKEKFDFIISNPPYIRTDEIPALAPEVQREPSLALDGGTDGLTFYRAILDIWLPLLKSGGALAVETGEDQGEAVTAMFKEKGLSDVKVYKDLAGLDRCIVGFSR